MSHPTLTRVRWPLDPLLAAAGHPSAPSPPASASPAAPSPAGAPADSPTNKPTTPPSCSATTRSTSGPTGTTSDPTPLTQPTVPRLIPPPPRQHHGVTETPAPPTIPVRDPGTSPPRAHPPSRDTNANASGLHDIEDHSTSCHQRSLSPDNTRQPTRPPVHLPPRSLQVAAPGVLCRADTLPQAASSQGPLRYSGSSILTAPPGPLRHVSARLRGPPESPRSTSGRP